MVSAAFASRKWDKRHAHVVEACRAIDVRDVLLHLDRHDRAVLRSWNPPSHPWLTLVPRDAGPLRRWWFVCPRCRRRCETLFMPPDVSGDAWRCRKCVCHGGLIYASQRHGPRHPLRQRLTARKRVSRIKAAARLQREAARAKRRRDAVHGTPPTVPPRDCKRPAAHPSNEKVIVIEVPRFGVEVPPIEQRVRVVSRAALAAEQRSQMAPRSDLRALLAGDAEANARFLCEHPKSRDVRARAARVLAQMGKRLGL